MPLTATTVAVADALATVPAQQWDALVPPDDPFTTHAFLSALEASGSVGSASGWLPAHVLARSQGRLVGAAPLYIKSHSYGEYIFDWAWADASERAGIPYYPKVLSAVPFTPATGQRLLVHPESDRASVTDALLAGMARVADAAGGSSIHLLFVTEAEWRAIRDRDGWIGRVTHQFHWQNQGYRNFEDWIGRFRSKLRKEARRERRRPDQAGARVRVLRGDALTARYWAALEGFYRHTVGKKVAYGYLTPAFFRMAAERLGHLAVALVAEVEGDPVAGALCFQRGRHLYGRYWGCLPGYEELHFELCYHRPIELCIESGWTRFEAGAQGAHKLRRGLMPARTYSAHRLRHQGLARAVAEAVVREEQSLEHQFERMAEHGPFRR